MLHPGIQQHHAGINPLWTAAFKGQLRRHLVPALPFRADQCLVWQVYIIEKDFGKMGVAREIGYRTNGDARCLQINDELGQASIAIFRRA